MSGKTSIIVHPSQTRFVQLQMDYLAICGGNFAEAKSLSIFEHWTNTKIANRSQARQLNDAMEREGLGRPQDEDLWVFMGVKDLMKYLMGEHSKNIVNRALQRLVAYGFLESRRNPYVKYDNKLQYRLIHTRVQEEIDKWAKDPTAYKANRRTELEALEEPTLSQKRDSSESEEASQNRDDLIPEMGQVDPDLGLYPPENGTTIPYITNQDNLPKTTYISASPKSGSADALQESELVSEDEIDPFFGIDLSDDESDIALTSPEALMAPVVVSLEAPSITPPHSAAPSPAPAAKKGKPKKEGKYPPGAMKAMTEAVQVACYPEGGVPKSRGVLIGTKAAELLEAGYSAGDVAEIAVFMRKDSFWKNKVTPGALVSEAPRWKAEMATRRPRPVEIPKAQEMTPEALSKIDELRKRTAELNVPFKDVKQ